MRIDGIILRELHLPLVRPFETSFGVTRDRRILLAEVQSEGLTGWGECTAGERPLFLRRVDRHRLAGDRQRTWAHAGDAESPEHGGECPQHLSARCAAIPWPRPRLKTRSGIWKRSAKAFRFRSCSAACATAFPAAFRSAFRTSIPELDGHHRAGTGGRLSAHQAEVQAGLGCRSLRDGAQPLARTSC